MGEAAFSGYRRRLIKAYAADKARAGAWPEAEAEDRATAELDGFLPRGTRTRDHHLYSVRNASGPDEVGVLWVGTRDSGRTLWIYDIIVHERFRRRGYASRILELAEEKARELGAGRVELHVFGHNYGARNLYEKLGYTVTSILMAKPVSWMR